MAKKSATSKGYRKSIKKKPFLTTKEIIALVVIVVAIIAAVVLFNVFFGSGYLKASDVKENDVVSIVGSDMKTRYVKVAEAGEIEGFTRDNPYRDINVASNFVFTPDDSDGHIASISLGGSFLAAADLADSNSTQVQGMSTNGSLVATQRYDVTVQGHDAYVYGYTNNFYQPTEDAEETGSDETPESNVFNQTINLYVDVGEGYTVTFHIYCTGEDDSYYLLDDEIVDYVLGYANQAVTVYEGSQA